MPNEDNQALVCLIEDVVKGTFQSFKWKKSNAEQRNYMESDFKKSGGLFSAFSVLKVTNTEWDNNDVYTCEAQYNNQLYVKKISKGTVPL